MDTEGRPNPQPPAGELIPSLPPPSKVAEVVYPMTEDQRDELLATLQQFYDESVNRAQPNRDIRDLRTTIEAVPREGNVYRVGLTRDDSGFMMAILRTGTPLRRQLLTIREEPDKLNGGRRRRKTRKARKARRKSRRAH